MDIASMLEVEVQEVVESKENVTPSHKPKLSFPSQIFSKEENDFYKLTYGSDVASIRFLRLHCTACDEHIGSAPIEVYNMHEHPVLRTLLCADCRQFYGDGSFEQGDDATDMFCRWCANGGNLFCCSYCSNTFCSKCIKRNFDSSTLKTIEAEDSWKCFVCDPKDLYPLRSVARALLTHIETVTRILDNDKRMSPNDIEEKMHLDETKCCSRKRKRQRRLTVSIEDEEDDFNNVLADKQSDFPPNKTRKLQKEIVCNIFNNGYLDHEYYCSSNRSSKTETDLDPTDLMIPCEQTMIEGEMEIINPNNSCESSVPLKQHIMTDSNSQVEQSLIQNQQVTQTQPPQQQQEPQLRHQPTQEPQPKTLQQNKDIQKSKHEIMQQSQCEVVQKSQQPQLQTKQPYLRPKHRHQQKKKQQSQQKILTKILPNNTLSINPVPLANLLKVAISTGVKKFKVTHSGNKKLLAVPISIVPKSLGTSSISFVKSNTPLIMPKNIKNVSISPQISLPPKQVNPIIQSTNVIDIDSDDEPMIVENNRTNISNSVTNPNTNSTYEINNIEESIACEQIPDTNIQINNNDDIAKGESITQLPPVRTMSIESASKSKTTNLSKDPSGIMIDEVMKSLKSHQREERYKNLLLSQKQEIEDTYAHLKTKIQKLIQLYNRNSKSQQEQHLIHSAAICTQRFNRAIRKAVFELAHVNDRIVRNYLLWTKKLNNCHELEENQDKSKSKHNSIDISDQNSVQSPIKNDLTLEMICVRDSASESDEDNENNLENILIEPTTGPIEFTPILNKINVFKSKPKVSKSVGKSSVLMDNKTRHMYDVPRKDYEKCIGYSQLTKIHHELEIQQEELRPFIMSNEHFGKYQEQYLFYLQHIEDYGIQTDEFKGLDNQNPIPLNDFIEDSSPSIMDVLEQFTPEVPSNTCVPPKILRDNFSISNGSEIQSTVSLSALPSPTTANETYADTRNSVLDHQYLKSPSATTQQVANKQKANNESSDESITKTTRAVKELLKLVSTFSEDSQTEQSIVMARNNPNANVDYVDDQTPSTVSSIRDLKNANKSNIDQIDDEIMVVYTNNRNKDELVV